jgi:hypothetical protein
MLFYYVLLFRMAILPLIVLAVVFCFRNHVEGDRRKRHAGLVGTATGVVAIASLLLKTGTAPHTYEVWKMCLDILLVLGAAGLLGLSSYAGMLLGDQQGGYWVKPNSRIWPTVLACLVGTGLAFLFSVLLFRGFGDPLAPGQIPSTSAEWGSYLCRTPAYSFGEEVFYRGWGLAYLTAWGGRVRFRAWTANLAIAIVFSVQHTGGVFQMLIAFWAGLILGTIFQRYGLIAAACTHLLLNLLVLVFPYVT